MERRGLVLLWLAGLVTHRAISDEGTVALMEFGSFIRGRVRLFFPDGATAQPRVKNLDAVSGMTFSADSAFLELVRDGEPVEKIEVSRLPRHLNPKAVVHQRPSLSFAQRVGLVCGGAGIVAYLIVKLSTHLNPSP